MTFITRPGLARRFLRALSCAAIVGAAGTASASLPEFPSASSAGVNFASDDRASIAVADRTGRNEFPAFALRGGGECEPAWEATFGGLPGLAHGVINALAVFDDGLGGGPAVYAGGFFSIAGGEVVNHIAKWDGTSWSPLGSGMNERIHALTVFDDGSGSGPALYAGGEFTTAGGTSASRIAKWDGTSWSAVGTGVGCCTVRALTVYDDGMGGGPALYVGGTFSTAGGG